MISTTNSIIYLFCSDEIKKKQTSEWNDDNHVSDDRKFLFVSCLYNLIFSSFLQWSFCKFAPKLLCETQLPKQDHFTSPSLSLEHEWNAISKVSVTATLDGRWNLESFITMYLIECGINPIIIIIIWSSSLFDEEN